MNETKNNYVTWRQFIFIIGIVIACMGYMINLGLDARERLIRVETNLDNLINNIDRGEITFEYNNK